MASEESAPKSEPTKSAPSQRPMSRLKRKKMLIAIGVIAVALVVVFWGWSSTGAKDYLQVGTLAAASSGGGLTQYMNQTLEVQGVITGWSGGPGDLNFSLADRVNPNQTIEVHLTGALPAEFSNGKTAVVKGIIEGSQPVVFSATEVTLGCASKY
jgi:cytochrome c-type biogenesis protein CcmE